MSPATINALAQLVALVGNTLQQYSAGTITDEQAAAMFASASDNLTAAIAAFNNTKAPGAA